MIETGRVLRKGPAGWWDEEVVSCPAVIPDGPGWRMYYYGRFPGVQGVGAEGGDGIPFGMGGLAMSRDGVRWSRAEGRKERGAVLAPSRIPDSFDERLVGCTDVVARDGEYWLYYMASGDTNGELDGQPRRGFPLRIGLATSHDGLGFDRVAGDAGDGAILSVGGEDDPDGQFVAWPRVLALPGGGWRMYYHGRGRHTPPSAFAAESADGVHWEKRGVVLSPNLGGSSFDSRAVSTRHVIPWQGGFLMAYEALPEEPGLGYRLGMATSADGISWERVPGPGYKGCSLDLGEPGAWDDSANGTPYLVALPDGSLRLYYVGFSMSQKQSGIGLAVCDGRDITRWERVPSPFA